MATTYELPKLPATADELAEMKNTVATTPVGGAVMFIAALIIYSRDHVEGLKALTAMTDSSRLTSSASPDAFKGYMLNSAELRNWKDRLGNKDYCARSYVQGMPSSITSSSRMPSPPFYIVHHNHQISNRILTTSWSSTKTHC